MPFKQPEKDTAAKDQHCGGDQYRTAMNAYPLLCLGFADQFQDQCEAQATHDNEPHNSKIHQGVPHEWDQGLEIAHQVKAGIAKSGNAMEYRIPDPFSPAIKRDKPDG